MTLRSKCPWHAGFGVRARWRLDRRLPRGARTSWLRVETSIQQTQPPPVRENATVQIHIGMDPRIVLSFLGIAGNNQGVWQILAGAKVGHLLEGWNAGFL